MTGFERPLRRAKKLHRDGQTGSGSVIDTRNAGQPARLGQDRPRLVVVEGINLLNPLGGDCYLSLRGLTGYSGMSGRWLRDRLTDPHHPLPCYRLPGGKILVRRSEFDAWLARYRRVGDPQVERIVSETLAGLR